MIWEARIGSTRLYAIEDGWFFRKPTRHFVNSDPDVWEAHPEFLEADGTIRISMGCFLIAGGDGLVMVDTGIGTVSGIADAEGGHMPEALDTLGIDPNEVTAVVHSHLHLDHFGGNVTSTGEVFFPRARFYLHQRELDYWLEEQGPGGDLVREQFQPLVDAGRVEVIDRDTDITKGITATEAFGHTPGHLTVAVLSQAERAYILGDATHHPLQVQYPEWNVGPDIDPSEAVSTRRKIFESLADTGSVVGAGHYPPPELGRVVTDNQVRVYMPMSANEIG